MGNGREKPHHSHEINDAYSEGWDARMRWRAGKAPPVNPYAHALDLTMPVKKQSLAREAALERDILQWQEGWNDCDLDLKRGDLDEVKPSDFRGTVWNTGD